MAVWEDSVGIQGGGGGNSKDGEVWSDELGAEGGGGNSNEGGLWTDALGAEGGGGISNEGEAIDDSTEDNGLFEPILNILAIDFSFF